MFIEAKTKLLCGIEVRRRDSNVVNEESAIVGFVAVSRDADFQTVVDRGTKRKRRSVGIEDFDAVLPDLYEAIPSVPT